MQYPLLSEYRESILNAEENFDKLSHLRPVLDVNGEPVMSSGNFAVVFKMTDGKKDYAIKCFTKEQEGRAEAYQLITEELADLQSTFIIPIKYFEHELFVDTLSCDKTEFPVLLMDWIEGIPLDLYIRCHKHNEYDLSQLAYQFSRLAIWLLHQSFAHGDLKPENIIVREDGTIVLVDYDGMYVPAMKGQQARELGSVDFRHPTRNTTNFDEHIDDFPLAVILLSLKAISLKPSLLSSYDTSSKLLFSESDYRDISQCEVLKQLYPSNDSELNILVSIFTIALEEGNLGDISFRLFYLDKPKIPEMTDEEMDAYLREMELEHLPFEEERTFSFKEFVKEYSIVKCYKGSSYYSVTDSGEEAYIFKTKEGREITVFNLNGLTLENFITQKDRFLQISLMKSCHFLMGGCSTEVKDKEKRLAWTDESGVMYDYSRKYLLGLQGSYLSDYVIAEGTEVICDDSLNDFFLETEGLTINGTLTIPSSVFWIGRNPFKGDYDTVICKSPHFIVENEAIYTSDKKLLISCFSKSAEFLISDGVKQIGSFAFYGCNIERIVIPESVSYIGENPFVCMNRTNNNCLTILCNSQKYFICDNALYETNPQRLIAYWGNQSTFFIKDGTISIKNFSLLKGVKNLYIPNSIQEVSENAFYGTNAVPKCIFIPPNSNEKFSQLIHMHKELLIPIDLANEYFDDYGVIYNAERTILKQAPKGLESYMVLDGTKVIKDSAFCCCHNLLKIEFPNSVYKISASAFRDCSSLKELDIPSSVKIIGNGAFAECKSLQRIFLTDTIPLFEGSLFLGCNNLSQIIVPNGTKDKIIELLPGRGDDIIELKDSDLYSEEATDDDFENAWRDEYGAMYSFDMKRLLKGANTASYTIKEGTLVICKNAFFYNKTLIEVFVPDTVVQIGEGAFSGCINLSKIRISESISIIKRSVFEYCHALTALTIPKSVKEIHQDAFGNCVGLKDIVFPNSLNRIGYQAFSGCKSLTTLTIPASVSYIDTFAFAGCRELSTIDFLGVPKLGNSIFDGCPNLSSIYILSWTKREAEKYLGKYYHLLDRTRDYPFKNSWPLKEFVKIHGDVKVRKVVDDVILEEYNLCVFTNSQGKETYARDFYYWGGEDICNLTGKEEIFRIGEDEYGDYQLYDKTLDFWLPGMSFEWTC